MAEEIVTEERLSAGHDYWIALRELGLAPEALLWTVPEKNVNGLTVQVPHKVDPWNLELSLVSGLVDVYGAKEIYELLYLAFERAGTPKNFDPWIISLYGTKSDFAELLPNAPFFEGGELVALGDQGTRISATVPDWNVVYDRKFQSDWVYVRPKFRKDRQWLSRSMFRLRRNVEALAA